MFLRSFPFIRAGLRWPSLTASLILVAAVSALAAYSIYACRVDYEERAQVDAGNLSLLLEKRLEAFLEKNDLVLRAAALEVERQESRGGIQRNDLNYFLSRQKALLPELKSLQVADGQGIVRYGTGGSDTAARDISRKDYFVSLRDSREANLVVSGPYLDSSDGQWTLALARRLGHSDGSFAGMAISTITADSFRTMLSSLKIGEHGVLAIHAGNLHLIAQVADREKGSPSGTWVLAPDFGASLKTDPDSGNFTAVDPEDGLERSFVYRKLANADLYVITGLATQDYLARWRDEAIEQAEIVGILALVVLGLAWTAKRALQQQRETSQLFREAIDSVAIGFAIFDPQDRLVVSNAANGAFFPHCPELTAPGTRFEDALRAGAGQFPEASSNPEAWIREQVEQHQAASGKPFEMELEDGRRLLTIEHRTDSGHIIVNRIDITELAQYRDRLECLVEARTAELEASIAQFRIFVEQAPTTIAMFDKDMNYLAASCRWEQLYGKGLESMAGQNYYEFHPNTPDRWKDIHCAALAGLPQERDDELLVRRDGRRQWLRWAAYPWRDERDQVGGIIMAVEDISARKEAEERLQESEKRFRTIFEQAAVGLAHLSLDGLILDANQKYADITGYSRQELPGLNAQEFVHPGDVLLHLEKKARVLDGDMPSYAMEKRYIRKDGALVWVHLTAALVRTAAGEPDYFLVAVEDIQPRKEAERALAKERETRHVILARQVAERTTELKLANKQLEGFLYAASHDLRGPLGRISSFSTLLENNYRDRLEGEGLLFLGFIRENAVRLRTLIDDLLNHARIDQQASPLLPNDLLAAVKTVLDEKDHEIQDNMATVQVSLAPVQVLAERFSLHQVLLNLMENALKYSATTSDPVIEIGGKAAEGRYLLWVRDNGIGFDMEYHDKIFEIFRRLHTHSEYAGSGVGLALVKRAMERMGGRVWAESAPGCGATFYLEFEIARDTQTTDA